jgi:fatty acid desaturase
MTKSEPPPAMCKGNAEANSEKVQIFDEKLVRSDVTATRNEYIFSTPFLSDALLPLLKDQRDVPMVHLLLNIAEVVVPGIIIVYGVNLWTPALPALARHAVGITYMVILLVLFLERFLLMLHFSSHRAIFHNNFLNSLPVWVMSPFFGVPIGIYKLHHVIMHHIENNHGLDISSTENFQRDSWMDFGRYWFHFVFLIWIELPLYCFKSKRYEWAINILTGVALYVVLVYLLARYVNFVATFWAFIGPYFIAMTAMSFGNWSQHIFVDPKDPTSNYHLTYNCLDHPTNQTTFNDGYHCVHHLNARLHWSEMPEYFLKNKDKHLDNHALTFRGIHFFEVGIMVMTKQLRKLATHYVHLGSQDSAPTIDEIEEKLREWLKPVPAAVASTRMKVQ